MAVLGTATVELLDPRERILQVDYTFGSPTQSQGDTLRAVLTGNFRRAKLLAATLQAGGWATIPVLSDDDAAVFYFVRGNQFKTGSTSGRPRFTHSDSTVADGWHLTVVNPFHSVDIFSDDEVRVDAPPRDENAAPTATYTLSLLLLVIEF